MRTLSYFDWAKACDIPEPELLEKFSSNAHWLLPQMLAFLANNIRLKRNDDGKISMSAIILEIGNTLRGEGYAFEDGNSVSSDMLLGMFKILSTNPRGKIFPAKASQNKPLYSEYCAAVPLFMSAFKKYRDVKYEEWDWSDPKLSLVLNKDILALAPYISDSEKFNTDCHWSRDELLQLRVDAMFDPKKGRSSSPESVHRLTAVSDVEFRKLPILLGMSLLQLWCFAPSLRTKYGIYDVTSPDTAPEPFDSADILADSLGSPVGNSLGSKNSMDVWFS